MRYKLTYLKIIAAISFIAVFSSGCSVHPGYMTQPSRVGYSGITLIGGAEYVQLSRFCEGYGSEYVMDRISKVAKVTYGNTVIKIMPDSNKSLINGSFRNFYPKTKIRNDEIYIPLTLANYLEKKVFKHKRKAEMPPIEMIGVDDRFGGCQPVPV